MSVNLRLVMLSGLFVFYLQLSSLLGWPACDAFCFCLLLYFLVVMIINRKADGELTKKITSWLLLRM